MKQLIPKIVQQKIQKDWSVPPNSYESNTPNWGKEMEKTLIRDNIVDFDIYDLEGSIEKAITTLIHWKNRGKEQGYENIQIIIDQEIDDEEPITYLILQGQRMETDDELSQRLKNLAKKELKKVIKVK